MINFENAYHKIVRDISHVDTRTLVLEQKIYLNDLISENVYPKIWRLFDFIKTKFNNLKEGKISFSKNELLSFADENWKFYEELKRLPDDIKLIIIYSSKDSRLLNFDFDFQIQGEMCEFANPNNWKEEYIWIDNKFKDFNDESFNALLMHEFGHVWTFFFGNSNDDFKIGQSESQSFFSYNSMTRFQKDVLLFFYNGKFEILKKDFNYILSKPDLDGSNYEFTSNIDEMIELLINDYLELYEQNNELTTFEYLWKFNEKMKSEMTIEYSSLNIVSHYRFSKPYRNFKNIQHIRNIVRRIFLVYAFGTSTQIEYFHNECENEFGKL